MRKILFLFICFNLHAQNNLEQFLEANKFYQEKNFVEAKDLYEEIIRSGVESSEIYYNLGNTYFRLQDYPRAILNYEKAKINLSDDADIEHNLKLSQLKIVDRIESLPKIFFIQWFDSFINYFSDKTIFWFSYVTFILTLILILTSKIFSQYFKEQKFASIIFATLFVISLFIGFAKNQNKKDFAIIIENVISTKSSPDAESKDLFVIHGGLKVELLDKVGDWKKIKLIDGKIGWLPKSSLEKI
ncbi:MAG: tetratricopeptide repeat protein [Bacteroidota bacterium]